MPYNSTLRQGLFDQKVILITGGGSGIGRCIAHELAFLGAHVYICGRTQSKLETVQQEIVDDGGQCSWRTCDIRDAETVASMISSIVEESGKIDGLVNNAGGQFPSPMTFISTKGFEAVIRNNLTGTFNVMREVFNGTMKKNGGSIVNITADHWGGFPAMAHTGAARAGVHNLTLTASIEWAHAGVRVNEIAPGVIMSSGMDTYDEGFASILRTVKETVPARRLGTESEVSSAVCFLLSEGAAYISGASLKIDGATTAGHREFPIIPHDKSEEYNGFHRAKRPKVFADDE